MAGDVEEVGIMTSGERMRIIKEYAAHQPVVRMDLADIKPVLPRGILNGYSRSKGYIIVDKKTHEIIDGNHRYAEAQDDGLKALYVKLVDPSAIRRLKE